MNSLETNNLFLLSTEELSKLEELLDNSSHVVICCHKSPDGDAVGSFSAARRWQWCCPMPHPIFCIGCRASSK